MSPHAKLVIFILLVLRQDWDDKTWSKRKVLHALLTSEGFREAFEDDIDTLVAFNDIKTDDPFQQPFALNPAKVRKFEGLLEFHESVEKMSDRFLVKKYAIISGEIRKRMKDPQFQQDHTEAIIMIANEMDDFFNIIHDEIPEEKDNP